MTVVQLQSQEFTLDEKGEELIALDESVIAEKGEEEAKKQRDARLKRWLSQMSPAATNATLNWSERTRSDGSKETVVRVTPQLGTKGGYIIDALTQALDDAPQHLHPTISLAWEVKMLQISGHFTGKEALPRLLAYQTRIDRALEYGGGEERVIAAIDRRLQEAKPAASPWAPLGF